MSSPRQGMRRRWGVEAYPQLPFVAMTSTTPLELENPGGEGNRCRPECPVCFSVGIGSLLSFLSWMAGVLGLLVRQFVHNGTNLVACVL